MKRTICVSFAADGYSGAVVLDATPVEEREHMAKVEVAAWYYKEFVEELVSAGWYMSEGAKANFAHQISILKGFCWRNEQKEPLNVSKPNRSSTPL